MKRFKEKFRSLGRREKAFFVVFFFAFLGCVFCLAAYRADAGISEARMTSLRRAAFASSQTVPLPKAENVGGTVPSCDISIQFLYFCQKAWKPLP